MTPGHEQEPLAEIARLRAELERALLENQLLREKINLMLARLFDKSSESVDPSQLELVLDPDEAKKADAAGSADPGPAAETPDATSDEAPAARTKRSPRKPRDTSHLHVEETVLIHDEVAGNPEAFREIERLVTDRFDYQPGRIFIHRTVRVVHVAKDNPDAVPLKPAAPPSLGLGATSRLVAYVTAAKYCHHRPHYRTEGILLRRHRVHFSRHKLCHWDKVVAETLEPLYKLVHRGLLNSGNLQADETPVKYLDPGKGKTSTGYLWVIHAPRAGLKGDILYQWHTSRKAACLDELLGKNYRGNLQTDAYAVYPAWAAGKDGIDLSNCWAHARREFHEALKIGQRLAAGALAAIQKIYQIETELRERGATADERAAVRRQRSAPVLEILKGELIALRQNPQVLPKGKLCGAVNYTLKIWDRLTLFLDRGEIEIDNNLIENGIRPTAVGKKNWLFVGETTGQRAAIIYTMVECAKRHGHDPEVWLADVLERLPAMTNRDDLGALLPSRWQPAAAPVARTAEACPA